MSQNKNGKVTKMARILLKYLSGDDDNNNEGIVKILDK